MRDPLSLSFSLSLIFSSHVTMSDPAPSIKNEKGDPEEVASIDSDVLQLVNITTVRDTAVAKYPRRG